MPGPMSVNIRHAPCHGTTTGTRFGHAPHPPPPRRIPGRAYDVHRDRGVGPRQPTSLRGFHDRRGVERIEHPGELLRAIRAFGRRARGVDADGAWPCRWPGSGHRHDDAFLIPHLRRTQPPSPSFRCGNGDGHAALPWCHYSHWRGGDCRVHPNRLRRDRHPDHDPGCSRQRDIAIGSVPRPARARDRARRLFQDRDAGRRLQAARDA